VIIKAIFQFDAFSRALAKNNFSYDTKELVLEPLEDK